MLIYLLQKVVVPIGLLAVLIFVHELGHFLLAKWNGIGVVKFSIGFGPSLFKFRRRETIYQIGLIPLGGFVRMVGDIPDMITGPQPSDAQVRAEDAVEHGDKNPETVEAAAQAEELMPELIGNPELQAMLKDHKCWFVEKGFWARSAVVVAGPLFNLFFAILTIWAMVLIYDNALPDRQPRIGRVMEGSPAEGAGLKAQDLVLTLNKKPMESWQQLSQTILDGTGEPITLFVQRGAEQLEINVKPMPQMAMDQYGAKRNAYMIGIGPNELRQKVSVLQGLGVAMMWAKDIAAQQYIGLWGMLTLKVSPKELGGPLFILGAAGQQAEKGWEWVLRFGAILSVCLAVLNLLPIPILDGGHLLFFILEAIFGPISLRKKEFAQQIGMVLLLGLMVFAIRNDLTRDPESASGEIKWKKQQTPEAQK